MHTLRDVDADRDNNFNRIRFLAAASMIFTHNYSLCAGSIGQDPINKLLGCTRRAIRCLGFFAALAAGLLHGFSEALLRLWLGPDFVSLAPLLCLIIAPLCINLAILPMFSLNLAVERVRQTALITLDMGVLTIGLDVQRRLISVLGKMGIAPRRVAP